MTASTDSSSSSYTDDSSGQGATQPDSRQLQSPLRSGGDTVFLKLQRLASRTEILFINEPRRNTKLLVLDLDHTLMDFSCRFDYMVEELKRPFLDDFLAQSYLYYDIAVWSQTNFKWLELKLTELGMLNRKDYKICFALVHSLPCFALSCLALPCLVLSCLVLSCLVLSCLALSCLVLPCLVLSCLVLSCLVLSCLALSCLALSCLALLCLALPCFVLPCLVSFCLAFILITSICIII